MKKHFLKSFALLAMLFSALTMSAKQYCHEPLTLNGGATIYLSCELISDGQYRITIEGENLAGLGGSFYDPGAVDLRKAVTTNTATKIVCDIEAASAPTLYTPLYVLCPGEQNIGWPTDINWTGTCGEGGEEPDPTPEPEEPETPAVVYCDFPTGHLNDANFGDANGRCLLTLTKISDTKVRVTVKPNYANGATKKIDYLYVISAGGTPYPAEAGADAATGYDELSVDITYASAPTTYSFTIQWSNVNDGGRWQLTPENITPEQLCTEAVEIEDVNFALTANGSSATASSNPERANEAIDNNPGSRWESASADPQTWTLDLGQLRIFNTLEIVWEGAYGKTFTVSASDDKETWTPIWTVEGQELAGFPYTQTQKIDKTTARYIQFHGTARGTQWGYSFYEFRVYLAGESTFTSLEATPTTNLTKVGDGNAITLIAKDQNGKTMTDVGEVTYTITPAGAGTINNSVYTPARIGLASIVATIGEVSAPAFEVFAYDGENVALSPDINNSKIIAQSDFTPSGTDAWHAIDGNEGNEWQGSATNGTTDDEAARTYDSWFVVDFGAEYDVNLVSINFEGACSQEYHVDFSADNVTWSLAYNYVGNAGINGHTKLIYGTDLQNATKVRYARFYSTKAATQYGMKIHEFKVFGTESATLTKTVSASVNDAAMGTATVTQNGVAVTEVETGSEVTFTAIANEGYAFVNWSNGNTNPSFTTTIDAAMHLTANFRALGNIYCNTEMTVDGHTIYVTMKRSAPETYQLIVRSEENLTNFGGTNFYRPNNVHVINLRDQGVLSDDKHILTATFSAETIPYMVDPLFVIFEGIGERTYPQLDNIEYDVECSEDVTVTGLALNPATVSIVLGDAQTLKPIFTPAHAFDNELDWTSSDETIVTVDANGVVTAVAEGKAMITAKLVSNPAISATCEITVEPISVKTWWGGFKTFTVNSQEYNVLYSFTRNEDRTITYSVIFDKDASAIGVKEVNVAGVNHALIYDNASRTASYRSTTTHSTGEVIEGYFYFGIVLEFNFSYIVGSSNERPNPSVESVTLDVTNRELLVNDQLQLTATVNPGYAANKNITWTSSNPAVAEVDANGLVTAKSAGTATITVTTADGGKIATCIVNVVDALTDATFYASGWFKENVYNNVGINYSITRTADRKLRYDVKINSNVGKLDLNVVDLEWHVMEHDAATNTYTYTTTNTYTDGEVISVFLRHGFAGGEGRWDFNYTVGSTNSPVRTMVGINDQEADQTTRLAQYTSPVDVVLARAITPDDDWFTISLPFALNATQITEIFGDGTQVLKLAKAGVAPDQVTELGFSPVNAIQAATPYLIKPTKKVNAGTVLRNITLATTSNPVKVSNVTMHPLLNQIEYDYTNDAVLFFLGTDNLLYYQAKDNKLLGLRAYFTFDGVITYPQAAQVRARVVFNENETTDLDNLITTDAPVKVIENGQLIIIRDGVKYNIQGQVIR